jgi:oligoribonuclease NrnB/cAMP/cGMP phosphodiesterase (DHH superfamily)
MMAKICLYHGSDLDGVCSAAIVKMAYGDTDLYPVEYGRSPKLEKIVKEGDDVTIVDFVLQPFELMKHLNENTNLTWIDHHDTGIIDYEEFIHCGGIKEISGIRDTRKSACELTWEYIYPHNPVPYSIWLLGRYDIWQHHESRSILPFQYGMKLNHEPPENTKFWNSIFNAPRDGEKIQTIIRQGKTIIKYRDKLNEKLCEIQAFKSNLIGYKCICVNRALCGSTVFDSIDNIEDYDIMVTFYICGKGTWNVSLYTSKSDIHVGRIAQLYGGGGHAGAAGFRCTLLPFEIST